MRYRTALILSALLIAAMFILPGIGMSMIGRYAEQGLAVPLYLRIFFGLTFFLLSFRWLLAPATLGR